MLLLLKTSDINEARRCKAKAKLNGIEALSVSPYLKVHVQHYDIGTL